jgi:low temperature requirement protein LtrA
LYLLGERLVSAAVKPSKATVRYTYINLPLVISITYVSEGSVFLKYETI